MFSISIFKLNFQTDNTVCHINLYDWFIFLRIVLLQVKMMPVSLLPVTWMILTLDFFIAVCVCFAYAYLFPLAYLLVVGYQWFWCWNEPTFSWGSLFKCPVFFNIISRWSRLILYVSRCRNQIWNWGFLQEYLIALHGKKYLEKIITAHHNFMASDNWFAACLTCFV